MINNCLRAFTLGFILVFITGVLFVACSERADAFNPSDTSASPRLAKNFIARDRVPGRVVHIQLQGNKDLMGARRAIESLDRQLAGIEVHSWDNASCKERPRRYCVTIKRVHHKSDYWGVAYTSWGQSTEIHLNTYYGRSSWVAQHEFLHALGMSHHRQKGMMNPNGHHYKISSREWHVLKVTY